MSAIASADYLRDNGNSACVHDVHVEHLKSVPVVVENKGDNDGEREQR